MGNWINTKFNNFYGIEKDVNKPRIGSFETLQNFDLRDKSGELRLRNGYNIKYEKISTSILNIKKITNLEYLKAISFWVDDHGGQEIILQFTKQRVTAQTTLTPNYFDMLGVWIRPYWNGSSWVDSWHWLNEIIITKITANKQGSTNDEIALYLQAESSDNNYFKNWSILRYTGNDYNVPNEISAIFSSRDNMYQYVRTHDYNNSWVINDKVILMKNYFPPKVLNELYNIEANEISVHNVLDDLRIGFGGQENRLAMSISFREKYFWSTDRATQTTYYQGLFLDPYNIITDFPNSFVVSVSASPLLGTIGFDNTKHFYKITALLDGYQEYSINEGSITPTDTLTYLRFTIKGLLGAINKRFTDIRVYIAEAEDDPYFLMQSVKFADSENGSTVSIDLDGNIYETVDVYKEDYDKASETLPDILGYSLPTDYVRSWDKAANIDGKVFVINPYIDKRYENIISYSEVSGAIANMPDVLAKEYFDINNFDGDTGISIKESPNGYLGIWSNNKFQLIHADNGLPLGLGTIYKGAVSDRSIVNLGQELVWASEYEINLNKGYQIADISKDSIRGDYRAISDKTKIVAVREEKGNCYRFFDGVEFEYILTERGWVKWKQYHNPKDYIIRKDGDVWFMKDGDIYYQSNYQDRKDSVSYASIPFILKSNPIDIRMLDASISFTERIYISAFYVNCSTLPLSATFKVYLDGELFHSKDIKQLSDLFFRLPTGANCKSFQIEFSGNGYEELIIHSFGVLWKPIKVGSINVKNY